MNASAVRHAAIIAVLTLVAVIGALAALRSSPYPPYFLVTATSMFDRR